VVEEYKRIQAQQEHAVVDHHTLGDQADSELEFEKQAGWTDNATEHV